jgi:prevent-host-death family protein
MVTTMTAREAKIHFWEFLDTIQRKPVIITKNNRPVWVMLSIEDAKNTLVWDMYLEKEDWYDEFFVSKVSKSLNSFKEWKNKTSSHKKVIANLWESVFAKAS